MDGLFRKLDSKSSNLVWVLRREPGCTSLYGGIYYAPTNSPYANDNVLEIIVEELPAHVLSNNVTDIYLMGDFNGRTGTLPDADCENSYDGSPANDIPERYNQDRVTNLRGEELLDLCKRTGLIIANGRIGADRGVGKHTCFRPTKWQNPFTAAKKDRLGCSVVDYLLVNGSAMAKLTNFDVLDRPESDHSPLMFSTGTPTVLDYRHGTDHESFDKVKWDPEFQDLVTSRFNAIDVPGMLGSISEMCRYSVSDAVELVYDMAWSCCDGMKRKAKPMHYKRAKRKETGWFDEECRNLKRLTQSSQRQFRATSNVIDLNNFWDARKKYQILIKEKKRQNEYKQRALLLDAANRNDNKFWNLLRENQSDTENPIQAAEWFEYFKNLYATTVSSPYQDTGDITVDNELDAPFTKREVTLAFKSAKPNKSCGLDGIPSDTWKCARNIYSAFVIIFNAIFEGAPYPEKWRNGLIIPLHKKGDPRDPNNYRGITLLSSLGKIFSTVFTNRLSAWIEKRNLLTPTQCGYRAGYSTIDNIFILQTAVSSQFLKSSSVFCAYVDFKKAYDYVDRNLLWVKLSSMGVSDKMLKLLQDFYRSVKSRVRVGPQHTSGSFESLNGLKQGENSSCLLFSCYINDICDYLAEHEASYIPIGTLHLTTLLFADDLAILDKTSKGLQRKLNMLRDYCNKWNLVVNEDKTKIMVFTRNTNYKPKQTWKLNGKQLETVKCFPYVGLVLSSTCSWAAAKNERARKGSKALNLMLSCLRKYGKLPVKFLLTLFDKKITPVLLYGCEIWGLTSLDEINAVADQFYRVLLGLRRNAPVTLARGELGRNSLAPIIYKRVVNYWIKLTEAKPEQAVYHCYQRQLRYLQSDVNCWLSGVREVLRRYGYENTWNAQSVSNKKEFLMAFKNSVMQDEENTWNQNIQTFGCLKYYKTLKQALKFEPFLETGLSRTSLNLLVRFRGGLLKIGTNEGRWYGTSRACPMCNTGKEENEEHFLFDCIAWQHFRRLGGLKSLPFFIQRNVNYLFDNPTKDGLLKLAGYIEATMEERQSILNTL